MLVFLSMIAAGVLLLSIIIVLQKLQNLDKVDSVDRTSPLPPLDGADRERVSSIADSLSAGFDDYEEDGRPASYRVAPNTRWLTNILAIAEDTTLLIHDWQSRSRHYLNMGDFPRALMSCAKVFPQMGAFRQACILIRGRIRELRKIDSPWEQELDMLYRIATWADLLHGKREVHGALSSAQVKSVDILQCQNLPLKYSILGYRELALLGSSDWKLLEERWGKPLEHHHAREIHGEALLSLLNSKTLR